MKSAPGNKRTRPAPEQTEDSPNPPAARSRSARPPEDKPNSGWRARVLRFGLLAKAVLGVVVVLGATAGVAWGAKHYATTSPRFSIKTVTIVGNSRLPAEEVALAGSLRLGDNVFAVDLEATQKAIESAPWVKSALVHRKLPGTVVVRVVEHEAAALVALGESLFLVSSAGEIFKQASPEDPLDLPVVTGLTPEAVAADRAGAEKRIVTALDLANEAGKRPQLARYPVQEVRLQKDGTVDLIVGADAIVLSLGEAPYRGKLEQAERVLAEVASKKAQPAVIFLDNESSPERVVVRMR